jgi:hypothetical protein
MRQMRANQKILQGLQFFQAMQLLQQYQQTVVSHFAA